MQKRRTRWPLERVVDTFLTGDPSDDHEKVSDPVVAEIFFLWQHYGLQPSMGTAYRHRACFANNESDLRITLDTRVQYHPNKLGLVCRLEEAKCLVDPEFAILEIKYSQTVPLWLCKEVSRSGFKMIRLSKYCTTIDKEYSGDLPSSRRAERMRCV